MSNELNTRDLLNLFKNNRRMIIAVILFFSLLGGFFSFITPPTYEVKTDLLVNYKAAGTGSSMLQSNEIDMSLRLIETYKYMLVSDRMVAKVISEIKEPYTKAELRKIISIDSINNSQIISIVAKEKTPEKAALLANTYANSFQEEVKTLMNLDNIYILNEISSDSDMKVIKMSYLFAVVLSFVLGTIVAVMIVVFQEFYFTKLNTISKIEGILKVPNIGTVPGIHKKNNNVNKWKRGLISDIESPIIFTEEFRRIRANLKFHMHKQSAKTVLVTSPILGDGKSMISRNLAIIMAMGGEKTVYVDADLRKPMGSGLNKLPERKGLISHILGYDTMDEIIQETETKNLYFVSSGPIPPNPTELLSSSQMTLFIEKLKKKFDVVIIDSPPLLVADAVTLSTVVDGCVYVIDAKRTKKKQASEGMDQLLKVEAPILGTVLNRGYLIAKHAVL